jgi:hypothetical protein
MSKTSTASQFDRIFKENMEEALPFLIKEVLQLPYHTIIELPDSLQTTLERTPDFLKRITLLDDSTLILQIEIQTRKDPELVFRMMEYFGIL